MKNNLTVLALFRAQCACFFFKIALKMLSKISSQLAHSENKAFRDQLSWLCLLFEATSNAILGNEELKL